MSTDTRLREELQAAGARLPEDHGDLARIRRRGARRRHRRHGAVASAIALVGVLVASGVAGSWNLPVSLPTAGQSVAAQPEVAIFFCDEFTDGSDGDGPCPAPATEADISVVRGALALDGDVVEVQLATPEQAYERFAELFADQPELVETVDPDSLPRSLRVTLAADVEAADIVARYDGFDGVQAVVPQQHD